MFMVKEDTLELGKLDKEGALPTADQLISGSIDREEHTLPVTILGHGAGRDRDVDWAMVVSRCNCGCWQN